MTHGFSSGWDFLVSSSPEDQGWAQWIAWVLEDEGFQVLLREWDSVPGTNWPALINRVVQSGATILPVLSPAYLNSDIENAEWQTVWSADVAGHGRRIIPIIVAECDSRQLGVLGTREPVDLHSLSVGRDKAAARDRLVNGVVRARARRGKPTDSVPFPGDLPSEVTPMVRRIRPAWDLLPELPGHFVSRDEDLARVRAKLVSTTDGPTVGLVGMGGVGKSTLARAIVHDPLVRDMFPDGVLWVDVHADPDTTLLLAGVLTALGDTRPVLDPTTGRQRLHMLLAGTRTLIVLDDVWDRAVLTAFGTPPGVRLLVTTRSTAALYADTPRHPLAEMDRTTARRMLAKYADQPVETLPAAADEVVAGCGGLPLALALSGSLATDHWEWQEIADALAARRLEELRGQFADGYQHGSLLAALGAGIRHLPAEHAERFQELSIFKGQWPVPKELVVLLWQTTGGLTDDQARALIRRFAQLSLVALDQTRHTVGMHDLLADYACLTLREKRFPALNGMLAILLTDRWGGLERGLMGLRSAAGLDPVDEYGVTRLVAHLLAADRRDLVDQLLATEWTDGGGQAMNAWYTVHDDLGQTGTYLATLRAIHQDSRELIAADKDDLGEAAARQVTCALLHGSVVGVAAQIPPVLLVRLLADGVWSPARTLAYALANPSEFARGDILAALAPHLPAELMGQALAATTALSWSDAKVQALAGLAPHLDPTMLEHARSAAMAIKSSQGRARALAALAPYLPGWQEGADQRASGTLSAPDGSETMRSAGTLGPSAPHLPAGITEEALAAAEAVREPHARLRALIQLARRLSGATRVVILDRAREVAAGMPWGLTRAGGLTDIATLMPIERRDAVLRQALDSVLSVTASGLGHEPLADLAPFLPAELLEEALTEAGAMEWPPAQVDALAALIPHLPSFRRLEAQKKALIAAIRIKDRKIREQALAVLVPELPVDMLGDALRAARAVTPPNAVAQALTGLVPYLPGDHRESMVKAVLAAVAAIDEPAERVKACAALAAHLPTDQRDAVLRECLRACPEALSLLHPHLTENERRKALVELETALALHQSDEPERSMALGDALTGIATHLSAELLGEALDVATDIADPLTRVIARATLARRMPGQRREAELHRAFVDAIATDSGSRVRALIEVAHVMTGPQREAALEEVLAAVTVQGSHVSAWLLRRLAPLLDAKTFRRVLTSVLPGHLDERAMALAELFPGLRDDQAAVALPFALATADALPEPREATYELSHLLPHLPTEVRRARLRQTLDAVDELEGPAARAQALIALLPCLENDEHRSTARRALDAVADMDDEDVEDVFALGMMLIDLVANLPAAMRDEVVAVAEAIDFPEVRSHTLARVAEHLPTDQRAAGLRLARDAACDIDDRYDPSVRVAALADVATRLPADDRAVMLEQAMATAEAAEDPYEQASALAALIDHLPSERRTPTADRVLRTVTDIDDSEFPDQRPLALARLIPQLPIEVRAPVAAMAWRYGLAIRWPPARAEALSALLPALPAEEQGDGIDRVWDAIGEFEDPDDWAAAMVELIPHLPDDLLATMLDGRLQETWPPALATVLAGLAKYAPEHLLPLVLTAAMDLDEAYGRAIVLVDLVPRLPSRGREVVVDQALADAATAGLPMFVLSSLVAYVPPERRTEVSDEILATAAASGRSTVAAVLPNILMINKSQVGTAAARSLLQVHRWWP